MPATNRTCPRCGTAFGPAEAYIEICPLCHVALVPAGQETHSYQYTADGLVYMKTGNGATTKLFRVVSAASGKCALQFQDRHGGCEILLTLEQLGEIVDKVCLKS